MKITVKKVISILILLLVGITFVVLNGWLPIKSQNTHPSCDQLPSVGEVANALEKNEDFIKEIESLSENIQVEVGQPCSNDQDRALVQITYVTKSEEKSIRHLITIREGFGVPIHLVKQ